MTSRDPTSIVPDHRDISRALSATLATDRGQFDVLQVLSAQCVSASDVDRFMMALLSSFAASPTLGSPSSIPVYKGDAFVPFSFEVGGDALNFMQELGNLLVDGAERLNATAYTTGSGSGQPTGIITSLVASAGTVPLITPATPEVIVAGISMPCRTRSRHAFSRGHRGMRSCRSSTRCARWRQPTER